MPDSTLTPNDPDLISRLSAEGLDVTGGGDALPLVEAFLVSEALLHGHFRLSSGLHSAWYFQCARLFDDPRLGRRLCGDLGRRLSDQVGAPAIDRVVGAAIGGIIVAHEVAAGLGVRGCFAERVDGRMELRRGFQIRPNERVLVAEDVVTTGGSAAEVVEVVRSLGGTVLGVATLVDRSGGKSPLDVPVFSLFQAQVRTWRADDCPLCRQGSQAIKPGSRPDPPPAPR